MDDLPYTLEEFSVKEEPRLKVRAQPVNFTLYAGFKKYASRIYNIKFRPGDIVLLSTPKSGTHWAMEMLWNISHNVDTETAKKGLYWRRVPMLEMSSIDTELIEELKKKREAGEKLQDIEVVMMERDPLEIYENLPSPRVCYTHLPLPMLPPNILDVCKVIYITRNPADVVCSYHPFMASRLNLPVDFETFFNMFLEGTVVFTPYWTSVREAWKKKDHPNFMFLLYEEMQKDLRGCIKKILKHVQHSLSEEQIDHLVDHLSFENMKDNPSVNLTPIAGSAFMAEGGNICRKGQVGDSKNTLSEDQRRRLKEWCDANRGECSVKFPGSDL